MMMVPLLSMLVIPVAYRIIRRRRQAAALALGAR